MLDTKKAKKQLFGIFNLMMSRPNSDTPKVSNGKTWRNTVCEANSKITQCLLNYNIQEIEQDSLQLQKLAKNLAFKIEQLLSNG
jgi:hypothetical protein